VVEVVGHFDVGQTRHAAPQDLAPGSPSCARPKWPPSLPSSRAAPFRLGGVAGGVLGWLVKVVSAFHSESGNRRCKAQRESRGPAS
jgi:hypothetical protein